MKRLLIAIGIMFIVIAGAYAYIRMRNAAVSCDRCNVIVLSLDTASGQHLPCNGYPRDTMPNLCAFADNHIFFPHTYSNAMFTLPTYVSFFTGTYPSRHGIVDEGTNILPATYPFLPSILKDHGYKTIFYMALGNAHMPTDRVYYRGIDLLYNADTHTWSDALRAFDKSVASGRKTMLFMHSYAAHAAFSSVSRPLLYTNDWYDWIVYREVDKVNLPQKFLDSTAVEIARDLADGKHADQKDRYESYLSRLKQAAGDISAMRRAALSDMEILNEYRQIYYPLVLMDVGDPKQRAFFAAVYDQKLHELDSGDLSAFLRFVSRPDIRKNTIVIIMSDHGEDFGEHGLIGHSTLYEPNNRLILTMALPSGIRQRVEDPVQTVDLMPTILDLLGIRVARYVPDGISLVPAILGARIPDRVLVAEKIGGRVIREGAWKLFERQTDGLWAVVELYNTFSDPGETRNLLWSRLDIAKRISALYERSVVQRGP